MCRYSSLAETIDCGTSAIIDFEGFVLFGHIVVCWVHPSASGYTLQGTLVWCGSIWFPGSFPTLIY